MKPQGCREIKSVVAAGLQLIAYLNIRTNIWSLGFYLKSEKCAVDIVLIHRGFKNDVYVFAILKG